MIVVGDIDRGGLLAHLFGTVALLDPQDQALVAGFIVNKFRGDPALLAPGLRQLHELTGRPTYGVLPYAEQLWLDAEDSVSVQANRVLGLPAPPRGRQWLRVAALRLPRISNSTDIEALACEPGVLVRWASEPADVADVDVIVVPAARPPSPTCAGCTSADWPGRDRPRPVGPRGAGHLRWFSDAVPDHRRRGRNQIRAGRGARPAGRRHRVRHRQGASPMAKPAHRLRDPPRPGAAL
ncbi:putative cobyric acid synthase [Mycobacterium xenopi 3993]|nr:putative cobyric acid synthase [Mycobacterium xenopi 3993]